MKLLFVSAINTDSLSILFGEPVSPISRCCSCTREREREGRGKRREGGRKEEEGKRGKGRGEREQPINGKFDKN